MLALTSGCSRAVQIRPNAVDRLDSVTYDTLLVAQSVLDWAKDAYAKGTIPPESKASINAAGKAYDALRNLWLSYRSSPSQDLATKISEATLTLNTYISQLRGLQ